jgi:hypothetical protein
MNTERRHYGLFFFVCVALVAGIGDVPVLRQKYAQIIPLIKDEPDSLDPFTPEQREQIDTILSHVLEGGTVLLEDPMLEGGPIPNLPDPTETDIEVVIPPGATDKPELIEELNIHISAPADAMVGDMVKLQAVVVGKPTAIKWLIDPPIDDFETLDGGLRAVFSNRNPGKYHVVCSIAGNDGRVDVDTHTFEIVPQPPENPLTPQTLANLTPQLSIEELIRRYLAGVRSPNKLGEAHAIAGSFRTVASTLRAGNIPGPDLPREVEQAAEIAIGPAAYKNWKPFFSDVRELLLPLNQARVIFTPEQYANSFENIASVLETLTTMESK